ncbi:MAG TPA: hypothetical protein VMF33_04090, partial [Acidimicrobiales bacterium]|nr:hypothetical protein [Acidimicrobiales bacterium]
MRIDEEFRVSRSPSSRARGGRAPRESFSGRFGRESPRRASFSVEFDGALRFAGRAWLAAAPRESRDVLFGVRAAPVEPELRGRPLAVGRARGVRRGGVEEATCQFTGIDFRSFGDARVVGLSTFEFRYLSCYIRPMTTALQQNMF